MQYTVDGWNNFCRVFLLPNKFPNDYCFSVGLPVAFMMVDWFNPIPELSQPAVSREQWLKSVGPIETKKISHQELCDLILPFLKNKFYIIEGCRYLILFNFGASIVFKAGD